MLKPKNLESSSGSGAYVLPEFMQSLKNSETVEISVDKLNDAYNHWNFYKPLGGDKMQELVNSIRDNGLIHPIMVMERNGEYTILSGHNRVRAYKILYEITGNMRYLSILAQIKSGISDDEARELIIDSNWVQRNLSTSERTKSIYQKYILLGRKKRAVNDSEKGRTYDLVAKDYNLSGKQIQRYIRLNNLIEPLLKLIDDSKISIRAGICLTNFDKNTQYVIYKTIKNHPDNKKIEMLNNTMSIEQIKTVLLTDLSNTDYIDITVQIPKNLADDFQTMFDDWINKKTSSKKFDL